MLHKKIVFSLSLLLVCAGCGPKPSPNAYNYSERLTVGSQNIMVEVVKSPIAMQKGLSDRDSLAQNQGMLFDFGENTSTLPSFWMKDMEFNLDLLWIYQNKIIGITPDVPVPDVNCKSLIVNCLPLYSPSSAINEVLEVNAGWTKENNIKVGDEAKLQN